MEKFTFYEVGGAVRDLLLGLKNKDIDYVAVPNDSLLRELTDAPSMFQVLVSYLKRERFEVFLETPNCYTIRAKFPEGHIHQGVADVVMARKEIGYIPGTRTPIVIPGTLYDDLERRDFTLNALAKDSDGNIIDFFHGFEDLKKGILRTPLDVKQTFDDDCLRIIRGVRFCITKGFTLAPDVENEMLNYDYQSKMHVISSERIREELYKCFKTDTLKTIQMLNKFQNLRDYIFTKTDLWLKPTNEK